MSEGDISSIGTIGNHYGGLEVVKRDGKFYWCIPDWSYNGDWDEEGDWEEIPKSLYLELLKFEETRKKED